MAGSYWERVARRRWSRRRALTGAAVLGVGAVTLGFVGCGGSDSGKPPLGDGGGLLSTPVDTTALAKPGGTLKDYVAADVAQGFDPLATNAAPTLAVAAHVYPRLLKFVAATYPRDADGSSEGDLADSFEISGDRLQLTFRLKQGLRWDRRSPTSGRAIDAQDVVFSWSKFVRLSAAAQDLAYNAEKAPGAPVESASAPDARTVVFKLKQPDSSLVQLFTSASHFFVMPRESDTRFDPRADARGHGPWTIEEYRPSALFTLARNPDYYLKDRPFIDRIEAPIVVDYAQRLAQFRAGNIWTDVHGLLQQDVVQTKKDVPESLLRQDDSFATAVSSFLSFGYEGSSPFKDVRLRQALSMLIDREAFIDVIANREGFRREGLELPVAYHTVVGAGWTGFWLDPYDVGEFGPNHVFLKLNPAEAKKLLAAAGHANGLDFDFFYNRDTNYGPTYHKIAELYVGNFLDGGMKARQQPIEYQRFFSDYYLGYLAREYAAGVKKGFSGVLYAAEKSYPTVASQLYATMHRDGAVFHGMTPDGREAHLGDPKVNDLIEKIKLETERARQQGLVHDLVRYATGQAFNIPRPAATKNFNVWWPAIGNLGVYRTYPGGNPVVETQVQRWIDTSQPPANRV